MAKEKPTARLENWVFARGRIDGTVYDHPRFPDGTNVTTSRVLSAPDDIKDGKTIETQNTKYELSNHATLEGEN